MASEREGVSGVGRLHVVDIECGNRARAIGDPVQPVVVKRDQHTVARDVGVGLEVPVPERDGDLKRHERVLGRIAGPATVGERDRTGVIEKRMHP